MNILVVEDDQLLRRSLGHYLVDTGHVVSSCSNGAEAVEIIKTNRGIDVVIVDIVMPVMSGASFVMMLKKYYRHHLPYIIVMSAISDGEDFARKLGIPYDHFIQKPIDFEDLGDLISSVARQRAS